VSDLQDALNEVVEPYQEQLYPTVAGEPLAVIVEAARRVANLDIDKATAVTNVLRYVKVVDEWDDMLYSITEEAVNAALGITEEDTDG